MINQLSNARLIDNQLLIDNPLIGNRENDYKIINWLGDYRIIYTYRKEALKKVALLFI